MVPDSTRRRRLCEACIEGGEITARWRRHSILRRHQNTTVYLDRELPPALTDASGAKHCLTPVSLRQCAD